MPKIIFNAFSFLQKKLRDKKVPCSEVSMIIETGIKAEDLILQVGLTLDDVEAVFINGKVSSFDTVLQDDDRVALVPPGTPGPYRVLLGFVNKKRK